LCQVSRFQSLVSGSHLQDIYFTDKFQTLLHHNSRAVLSRGDLFGVDCLQRLVPTGEDCPSAIPECSRNCRVLKELPSAQGIAECSRNCRVLKELPNPPERLGPEHIGVDAFLLFAGANLGGRGQADGGCTGSRSQEKGGRAGCRRWADSLLSISNTLRLDSLPLLPA